MGAIAAAAASKSAHKECNYEKFLVSILLVLLVLTGCQNNKEAINFVGLDEIKTKIENKDDFIFVVGLDTCPACLSYKPVLEEVNNKKMLNFII